MKNKKTKVILIVLVVILIITIVFVVKSKMIKINENGERLNQTSSSDSTDSSMPNLFNQIGVENYGQEVNYSVSSNNVTLDNWKIFYKDTANNKLILIYGDYMLNSAIPTDINCTKAGNYRAWWSSDRTTSLNDLQTSSKWSSLIRSDLVGHKDVEAKGGIDIETWIASWNESTNATDSEKLYTKIIDSNGYSIKKASEPNSTKDNFVNDLDNNSNKSLYFPHNSLINDPDSSTFCNGYWLTSPSSYDSKGVIRVGCTSSIGYNFYTCDTLSIRPVIFLPSNILGSYNETTQKWDIGI